MSKTQGMQMQHFSKACYPIKSPVIKCDAINFSDAFENIIIIILKSEHFSSVANEPNIDYITLCSVYSTPIAVFAAAISNLHFLPWLSVIQFRSVKQCNISNKWWSATILQPLPISSRHRIFDTVSNYTLLCYTSYTIHFSFIHSFLLPFIQTIGLKFPYASSYVIISYYTMWTVVEYNTFLHVQINDLKTNDFCLYLYFLPIKLVITLACKTESEKKIFQNPHHTLYSILLTAGFYVRRKCAPTK